MPEVVRKRVNLPTRVEGDGRTLDYAVVHDTKCRASVSSGEQARSEPKERPVSVAVVGTTASSRGVRRSRSATREIAEQRGRAKESGDGRAGLRSRHSGRRTVLRCSVLAFAHCEHWASRAGRESRIAAGRWTRKSRLSESVNFVTLERQEASVKGKLSRYETCLQRPDGSSGESDRFHAVRTTNGGFTFGPAGNRRLRRISAESRRGAFLNPNRRTENVAVSNNRAIAKRTRVTTGEVETPSRWTAKHLSRRQPERSPERRLVAAWRATPVAQPHESDCVRRSVS